MRTSYSSLNTYKSCPLRFKYQEIDKIKAPKSKEAVFGASVHEALRFMFKRNPLYPTIHEVLDFFSNTWNARASKIEISEEEKQMLFSDGEGIIKNFYNKNQPWNFNTVDLESRFDFVIEDEKTKEKHTIAGIIDRIDKNSDSEYEILDYKTANRMSSKDSIDKDMQMSIYHLGILNRWPHLHPEAIKLSLYFLKHNEKISTSRLTHDIEKTKKSLLALINEIQEKQKNGDFPPTPSALCGWCGYQKICPMWKHEYNKSQISNLKSQNEIQDIINEYLEIKEKEQKNKKRVAELQKELHFFMDSENVERVFGENYYITRKLKETLRYDPDKLKEILEPIGKFQQILKIDETLLNKIMPKFPPEIQEKLKSATKEIKTTKTLTVSKIKK